MYEVSNITAVSLVLPGKLSGSAMFTKYIFGFEVIYFSRYMFSFADVNCCLPELELGLKNCLKLLLRIFL